MDLIRDILIWGENNLPEKCGFHTSKLIFPGFTSEEIGFHIKLLVDNGFIEAIDVRASGDKTSYLLNNLTWNGYDFLGAMKSDTVWNGMKEAAQSMGIQAIKLAFPIIVQLLAKQAGLN